MATRYSHGPNPEQESLAYLAKLTDGGKKKLTGAPETYCSLMRDPAIEKFGWIRENSDKYFKFKPRSIFYTLMAGLVVPGTLFFTLKYFQRQKDIKAGRPPRDFL